jgi:hypothetical protein
LGRQTPEIDIVLRCKSDSRKEVFNEGIEFLFTDANFCCSSASMLHPDDE